MKVIYCHHAQRKKGNPPSQNDDITDFGVRDAKLNSELFYQIPKIKAIYTSHFYRCMKTAQLINEKIQVPIYEDERLNEYGSIKGESWIDLQKRVINCLNDLNNKYNEDDIIICVTSGVNLGAFICWSFDLKPSEKIPFIGVSSCSPLVFEKKKD